MTGINKFENLTAEHYKEGNIAAKDDGSTDIEQRGWVKFIKAHTNIKAYFHGNSNYNEFYVYNGPEHDAALNTFRVDSPIKGEYSSKDETKLSFQLISIGHQALPQNPIVVPQILFCCTKSTLWHSVTLQEIQILDAAF
jgi:hypothetical protein